MASHRRSMFPVVVVAGLTALACGPAGPRLDDGVQVRRGGDLLAADSDVAIRDSVHGDVMAAGGDIRFDGYAGGDYLGAGGNQVVRGTVLGNVRAAGGNVVVGTDVGRNTTLAGGNVELERTSRVGGNAYLVGGAIRVDGTVERLVRAAGREVVLNGTMGSDVLIESRELRVGPDAVIAGNLRYRLERGREAQIDPGAEVRGRIIPLEPRRGTRVRGALRWIRILGFLVAGAAVVAILPRQTLLAETRLRTRAGFSVGLGLGWLLLVPLVCLAIAITIIGIPLAFVTAALYVVSVYLAAVIPAVWLGRLARPGGADPGRGDVVLAFLIGGVAIMLVGLIPYAGALVRLVATVFGLGAAAVMLWEGGSRTGSLRSQPSSG